MTQKLQAITLFLIALLPLSCDSQKAQKSIKQSPKTAPTKSVMDHLKKNLQPKPALNCQTLPILMNQYLRAHIIHKQLTGELKKRTLKELEKYVDSGKTLFLENEIIALRQSIAPLFSDIDNGKCERLLSLKDKIVQKSMVNEAFVKSFLKADYKLDKSIKFQLYSEKRKRPTTTAEQHTLLKKSIHFQIANYVISGVELKEAKEKLSHRYELFTKRAKDRSQIDMFNLFLNAFSTSLDPHSSYYSMEAMQDFQIQMSLSLEGIGATLSSQDGFTVVEDLVPGGPADKGGDLKPKDKIIAVADDNVKVAVNVIDMDLRDVVKKIRGKKHTKVHLTVLRKEGGSAIRKIVTITRDKVDLKEDAASMRIEEKKIGNKKLKLAYIELPSFYQSENGRSCSADVKKLLIQANQKNVDGLVLNFARNGGGSLDEAKKLGGLFINKGNIVATKNQSGMDFLKDKDSKTYFTKPMIILTSRRSASASEIVAGALKDYNRALIVGSDHTYGKGSVQQFKPIGPYGAIKVTMGMFFIPGGSTTQHSGVSSHFTIPSIWNSKEIGENKLDYSLKPQTVSPFISDSANSTKKEEQWLSIEKVDIALLKKRSTERVSKSKEFTKIKKDILDNEIESQKNEIVLADYFNKTEKAEKKKKENEGKSRSEIMTIEQKPQSDEALNILADLVLLQNNQKDILNSKNLYTTKTLEIMKTIAK